ncbi:MAG TPA: hypothetical protein VHS06_12465 [Chloroflexota bacterium]|nr:hypothetical protein [Chloroflexota bacterium]
MQAPILSAPNRKYAGLSKNTQYPPLKLRWWAFAALPGLSMTIAYHLFPQLAVAPFGTALWVTGAALLLPFVMSVLQYLAEIARITIFRLRAYPSLEGDARQLSADLQAERSRLSSLMGLIPEEAPRHEFRAVRRDPITGEAYFILKKNEAVSLNEGDSLLAVDRYDSQLMCSLRVVSIEMDSYRVQVTDVRDALWWGYMQVQADLHLHAPLETDTVAVFVPLNKENSHE